jgi:hypothetical protein
LCFFPKKALANLLPGFSRAVTQKLDIRYLPNSRIQGQVVPSAPASRVGSGMVACIIGPST